jgi:hypothetical protein
MERLRRRRLRHGFAKIKIQAIEVSSQGNFHRAALPMFAACGQATGATVVTVRVAVPAAAVVMLTVPVEPKLNVGRFVAPAGLDVRAAVSATLPSNPPDGVMVIVD